MRDHTPITEIVELMLSRFPHEQGVGSGRVDQLNPTRGYFSTLAPCSDIQEPKHIRHTQQPQSCHAALLILQSCYGGHRKRFALKPGIGLRSFKAQCQTLFLSRSKPDAEVWAKPPHISEDVHVQISEALVDRQESSRRSAVGFAGAWIANGESVSVFLVFCGCAASCCFQATFVRLQQLVHRSSGSSGCQQTSF